MEQNSSPLAEQAGPEPQNRPKKAGKVNIFIRWFFIVFFAIVLLAGIYFKSPWKALALVGIFLVTLTIIPVRIRKWIWAGLAFLLACTLVWIFLPLKSKDGWEVYRFEKEMTAWQEKHTLPDEENAAIRYQALMDEYDWEQIKGQFRRWDPNEITETQPWTPQQFPQAAGWFEEHKFLLDTLTETAQKERCWFGFEPTAVKYDKALDAFSCFRSWTRLLLSAADLDRGTGDIESALEKQMAVLRMGSHVNQQDSILSVLTGIAIQAWARKEIKMTIMENDLPEGWLNNVKTALQQNRFNWQQDWIDILENEELFVLNHIGFLYEVDAKGTGRLSRYPNSNMWKQYPDFMSSSGVPPLTYKNQVMDKVGFLRLWFFFPSDPEVMAEKIHERFLPYYDMAKTAYKWDQAVAEIDYFAIHKFWFDCLSFVNESIYYRIHDIHLRTEAGRKGCLVLVALIQYKNQYSDWPATLDAILPFIEDDDLLEPIRTNEFVYKIREKAFLLYHIGLNGADDGGIADQKTEKDDILLWPPKEDECD